MAVHYFVKYAIKWTHCIASFRVWISPGDQIASIVLRSTRTPSCRGEHDPYHFGPTSTTREQLRPRQPQSSYIGHHINTNSSRSCSITRFPLLVGRPVHVGLGVHRRLVVSEFLESCEPVEIAPLGSILLRLDTSHKKIKPPNRGENIAESLQ